MEKCLYCEKEFESYKSLSHHTHQKHKIKPKNFYSQYYLGGKYPTCKCGCGEYTTWKGHYYAEYIRGHISRVKNNWGHNPKAIANSIKIRNEIYIEPWNKGKKGVQNAWNRGLTKETNPSVASAAKKLSKIKNKDEKNKKRIADISREYWSKQENRDKQSELIRIKTLNRIEKRNGQVSPNYNSDACKIIEYLNKCYGYSFQHAENGGEVCIGGYYPDGLDKEQNLIVEVDESYHFDENDNLRYKDIKRQKYLENKGYTIIRLKIK